MTPTNDGRNVARQASTQLERLAATCDKFPTQVLLRALGNSPCFKKHSGPCAADGKKIKALRAEAQVRRPYILLHPQKLEPLHSPGPVHRSFGNAQLQGSISKLILT